jgi:hypothetical protein
MFGLGIDHLYIGLSEGPSSCPDQQQQQQPSLLFPAKPRVQILDQKMIRKIFK